MWVWRFFCCYKREDLFFSASSESVYGSICISICSFSACVYVLSETAPWRSLWNLSEALLKAAGIGAAGAAKRNRQNSLVSVCESVCHKDLLPTPSMTALFRRCHPHGAEDRQGQQPERTVPQVGPATPHKRCQCVTQEANELTDI